MQKRIVLIFFQSTDKTAEENRLRILKRKNSRHKGGTGFTDELRDTATCCGDAGSSGVLGSTAVENGPF